MEHTPRGRSVITAGTRRAPLKTALERQWDRAMVAPILDEQIPSAVNHLFKHHQASGFFENRFHQMKHLSGFEKDGFFEAELVPNRSGSPVHRHAGGPAACPLCSPSDNRERGLAWRQWIIWPNAFPYVPAKEQHVVLMPARHQGQGFSREVLGDMIDFQHLASRQHPVSLHYNGIAGNSQFHLHWQATRVTFPLQRALEHGRLGEKALRQDSEGSIATFDRSYSAGFLVRGTKPYVMSWADILVRFLDADPLTQGRYNLILLKEGPDREARLVIIPRSVDKPQAGSVPLLGIPGAFAYAGFLVIGRQRVPENLGERAKAELHQAVVAPSRFSWLDSLKDAQGRRTKS